MPGVPAATAVPAYAGIPLTPAGVAGFAVVHPGGAEVDWSRYAAKDQTLVVLDAVDDVLAAAAGLLAAGADPQTPAAVTSAGTTVNQRTSAPCWASSPPRWSRPPSSGR